MCNNRFNNSLTIADEKKIFFAQNMQIVNYKLIIADVSAPVVVSKTIPTWMNDEN